MVFGSLISVMRLLTYKRLCLFSLWLITFNVTAQVLQPHRFEHEQKNYDDYYHVISLKEKGLALFRDKEKYKNNNKLWELIFLDTTLNKTATLELEILHRHKMLGYEIADDRLYFLFRTGETTKNDLVLIEVSYAGKEIARYEVKPELDLRLTHFIKAGDNFIFGGYVNNEAVIVLFEPETKNMKVIPGFFQKDTELVDLRTNQNQTFNTVLINRGLRGERKMFFRTFDSTGKQLLEDVIQIEENMTLQTGITSELKREDLLVAGTWGDRNSKQSHGFYAVSVDPFSAQKIQYIDFGRLNHFVDFLKEKRASKIKENAKEDAKAGKEPSFTSHVMPFRIAENNSGFYLLAEVYNPSSSASMNGPYPYPNNPYGPYPYWPGGFYYPGLSRMYRPYMYGQQTNSTDVKTLATVLVAFDGNGQVKWDQSIKVEDINLPGVEQISDFTVTNEKAFLIYKKESELKVKTVVLGDDASTEHTENVKTLEDADVIRSEKESENGVRHWYKNSFYVWGYQTIKNATREDRVRDVFYINRVDLY